MALTMTTKLTKGGQTTIPKEIRAALGIGDEARVWWRQGVELAMSDVASGRTRDARELSQELRERHGLQ